MVENEQASTQDDQIVFEARYSPLKVWFSLIVVGTLPLLILFCGAHLAIGAKKYLGGAVFLFFAAPILLISLDAIFCKQLLFYPDRVAKVWYLFGQKTISYSKASVKAPDRYTRLISSAHFIFESQDNGRPVPLRLPLLYHSFFFPTEAAKEVGTIMEYLTDHCGGNPRKFKKASLSEEVICPERLK